MASDTSVRQGHSMGGVAVRAWLRAQGLVRTAPERGIRFQRIAPALIVGQAGVALPDHPAPLLTDGDILAMADLPPCAFDFDLKHRDWLALHES